MGRAAVALLLVEMHEAVDQHLARQHLHLRVERRAHREAAFVELLLGIILVDVAANLLSEILGREDMRSGRPRGDLKRLFPRLLRFLRRDVVVLGHAIDDVVAPLKGALALTERMIVVGRLGQRGEIGRFRHRQFVHRFVEVEERSGRHAIGSHAEIDLIEVEL